MKALPYVSKVDKKHLNVGRNYDSMGFANKSKTSSHNQVYDIPIDDSFCR